MENKVPFPKTGDFGKPKNYWGITLTSIAAKIYNTLLLNCIEPEIEKILRKNQNGFRRNLSTALQILTIRQILEGFCAIKPWGNIIICSLLHSQREDGAYSLSKETVAAIMMLYKNTEVNVCSPDGDTDFFDIVAGVLQEDDTLAPYMFIICLNYMLQKKMALLWQSKKQTIPCTNNYRCRLH